MIYTDLTKKAMRIAYDAHHGQFDKSGLPYIYHPIHLAEQMQDETAVCAALLHDVVEDTPRTFDDLAREGIPDTVLSVLRLLTKPEQMDYHDYIRRICQSGNVTAIAVKLADLRHNSDSSRLNSEDDKTRKRIAKYRTAIETLEQIISNRENSGVV